MNRHLAAQGDVRATAADRRIPELDGLRGLAILLILLLHYCQNALDPFANLASRITVAALRLSWSGVDLFFVLSGFLIGGILLDAQSSSNYYRVFYTRRFFRIVPVYAAFLVGFLAIAFILPRVGPGALQAILCQPAAMPWYSYATFTHNFWMTARDSFGPGPLTITWSLAVEEQFYLTLPVVIRKLSRRNLVRVLLCGIALAPVLRAILLHWFRSAELGVYVLMPCRMDALLMGVLAALLLRDAHWREKIARANLFFGVTFAVFAAGLVFFMKFYALPSALPMGTIGLTWLAFSYTCVLLFALTRQKSSLSGFLRNPALAWLGAIAYGVYLFHRLVAAVVFGVFGRYVRVVSLQDGGLILLALVFTLVLARLSWVYFERPLVQLGHRSRYASPTPQTATLTQLAPEVSSP